jgi:hypothetical protein
MAEEEQDERKRKAQRVARAAVTECARAIRIVTARAETPDMLDEALAALNLVRSLAPDDPIVESLAAQLILSCKGSMVRTSENRSKADSSA